MRLLKLRTFFYFQLDPTVDMNFSVLLTFERLLNNLRFCFAVSYLFLISFYIYRLILINFHMRACVNDSLFYFQFEIYYPLSLFCFYLYCAKHCTIASCVFEPRHLKFKLVRLFFELPGRTTVEEFIVKKDS